MKSIKIHLKTLWKSFGEVTLLSIFTFLPLFLNTILAVIVAENKIDAIAQKIVPGEMLAYCLSFISPLFLLFLKTHGNGFKIPGLSPVFLFSLIVYILTLILTIIAKNQFIKGIDLKPGHLDWYFWLSASFLASALILRVYTSYHNNRYSNYQQTRSEQQGNFNAAFRNSIG